MTFFISLPKNNIKNIKKLFEENDLKIDRMLCSPLATGINVVNQNNDLKNFFLINIDDELSTISIYENSTLVFFKTFPFERIQCTEIFLNFVRLNTKRSNPY